MPSGTFRRAQCLQAVTILNTIALKKKKKSLTKKSQVSQFSDISSVSQKCKLANGRERWCGKLWQVATSFSFKDTPPATSGGSGPRPSRLPQFSWESDARKFSSSSVPACRQGAGRHRRWNRTTYKASWQARHRGCHMDTHNDRWHFPGTSEDKWTSPRACNHHETLKAPRGVPEKHLLLVKSNLKVLLRLHVKAIVSPVCVYCQSTTPATLRLWKTEAVDL